MMAHVESSEDDRTPRIKSDPDIPAVDFSPLLRGGPRGFVPASSPITLASSTSALSFVEALADRGQGQVEVRLSIQERYEAVLLVEASRLRVDGIHLHGVDAELLREPEAATQGINEQGLAESQATDGLVDRQAREQDDRHGVPGEFPGGGFGDVLERHGPGGERIVTVHGPLARPDGDVGASQVPLMVLAHQPTDELVERGLATRERPAGVIAVQRARSATQSWGLTCFRAARFSASVAAGGWSRRSRNRSRSRSERGAAVSS